MLNWMKKAAVAAAIAIASSTIVAPPAVLSLAAA